MTYLCFIFVFFSQKCIKRIVYKFYKMKSKHLINKIYTILEGVILALISYWILILQRYTSKVPRKNNISQPLIQFKANELLKSQNTDLTKNIRQTIISKKINISKKSKNVRDSKTRKFLILFCIFFTSFIGQHSNKKVVLFLYHVILSRFDIPVYIFYTFDHINFNFLFSIYNLITISNEKDLCEFLIVSIPQYFLIYQHISFIIPIFSLFIYRYIKSYLNERPTYLFLHISILICACAHVIFLGSQKIRIPETDFYIMDRAKISLMNAHDAKIEGEFEIIKVHEEIEVSDQQNISNGEINQDTKKIHNQDSETVQLANAEKITKKTEKRFKREVDPFFKNNDLLRLKYLPYQMYLTSLDKQLDSKFDEVILDEKEIEPQQLWKVMLSEGREYLKAGEFFRIMNMKNGKKFGIRSDKILATSDEGKVTRQQLLITKCQNHSYYQSNQETPKDLQRAKSKTKTQERLFFIDFGFNINLFDTSFLIILLVFVLFNSILHRRFGYHSLIDEELIKLLFFGVGTILINDRGFFKTTMMLIIMKMTHNIG